VELTTRERAQRVIIVSLPKSGTHLIQEMMVALGYRMYGSGVRLKPENMPVLDEQTRWRIARLAYDEETLDALRAADKANFNEATDRAWDALGLAWELRLAQPIPTWYTRELVDTGLVRRVYKQTVGSDFADTPAGVCWMISQLDITKIDGHFLHEWAATGEPRIIYNYRDPRDMVLSAVNFLYGKTGRGVANYNDTQVFSDILRSKATLEDQLEYALTDSAFPTGDGHQKMLWLLNHPNVCKTSFEELVGPKGGGSIEEQSRALTRVMAFLDINDREPGELAHELFNPDSFSFYRGQIGAWREAFTPALRRLAGDRYREVLQLYGYE
jgi:Sulfotransferase domain